MSIGRTWDYSRPRVWDHSRRRRPWLLVRAQRVWAKKWARVQMAWAILSTIWGWSDAQLCDTAWLLHWWPTASEIERGVVCAVSKAVEHPAWPEAIMAVERTSYTLGLNRGKAWVALSHGLKDKHEWAESLWRHLYAMKCLHASMPGRLTDHERNLLVELAYIDHARRGKRQRGVSASL